MPDPAPPPRRYVVRISTQSAVVGVVVVVLAVMAQRVFVAAHAPLSWAAASVVVAVLIDPIVDRLDRRIPRLPAVVLALLLTAAAVWGVVYVAFDDLSSGLDQLGEAAQEAADELEARTDSLGRAAQDVDASRRVEAFVDALDERVTGREDVLATTAGTAPTYFVAGIFTLFLMSYGPRLARAAVDQLPDPGARRAVTGIVTRALHRSRRAVFLIVAEGLAAGVLVAGAAALLDVPSPAALGLAAGIMALLPHVGLVLGTLPLILLVLALRSDLAALVTLAVVLACQMLDSFWLRRRIARRSVHTGLLVPWVVALVGYAVYGVGGTAYGLAFAVFALAVVDEVGAHRRTRDAEGGDRGAGREGPAGGEEPAAPEAGEGTAAGDEPAGAASPAAGAVRPRAPAR